MFKFKPLEISALAQHLLAQLQQDDVLAQTKGRSAQMMTSHPQEELECLRALGLINRAIEIIPIGQVYIYSLTELGRNYICAG